MGSEKFTPRMQQIIRALLKEERPVPVKYLADQIHVSKRTVQRELEYLPKVLKKCGIEFCSRTGTGVWLEGNGENKARLLEELEDGTGFDASDRGERRKRLILEILKDKTLKKLYYYSDMFGVSEATVSSDLEDVEGWLGEYHLKIMRKPGYGIFIEGSEKNFRRALRAFIDENINTRMIREMYEDRGNSVLKVIREKNEKNIYRVLDDEIVRRVTSCILKVRDKRVLNLTEDSYLGLVIHVTIAVNRILKQELMEENEAMIDALRNDGDFELAGKITAALAEEFEVEIPEIEQAYICLHIKGSKVQQVEVDEASKTSVSESRELWEIVNEMIDCYDPENAWLLKQDEEFVVQGLIAHLKPTLVRLANGMKIENPLLDQIKTDYHAIFERCEKVAGIIEERYGYPVPEPEIGFLAIHFGAAEVRLEGRRESRRKVEIGIVCASGIGISRLMSSKIARAFADRVEISTYGMADLTPYARDKMDFFVSTLTLKEEADIIYASPLLTAEDMEHIAKKVRQYEYLPKREKDQEFTGQLDQVNYMAGKIKHIIRRMEWQKVDNAIAFEELLVAVSEEQTPYADRRRMIQEDLKRREDLASQVFPEFGFALFHTRTAGVINPSFSVAVTKDGQPFTNPYFKGIHAAIIMLVPQDEHVRENSEILGFLSEKLVDDEEFLNTILKGKREQVRELVSGYLNQFFKQYLDKM